MLALEVACLHANLVHHVHALGRDLIRRVIDAQGIACNVKKAQDSRRVHASQAAGLHQLGLPRSKARVALEEALDPLAPAHAAVNAKELAPPSGLLAQLLSVDTVAHILLHLQPLLEGLLALLSQPRLGPRGALARQPVFPAILQGRC
jgi:hypothetical protein